jgi:ABC-type uncharacterized transport system permease subunit
MNADRQNSSSPAKFSFLAFLKKCGVSILSFFHWLHGFKSWRSFLSSAVCVLIGLLAGFILMLCLDPNSCWAGLKVLLTQGFSSPTVFARVIYQATPMMLSGLGIAFAFRLGLFNIGITGQVTAGAFVGLLLGLSGQPWYVCLLVAMVTGGFFGFITGFLKAHFNVNEVLSGIMLNWIIYYFIGLIGTLYLPSSFKNKIETSKLNTMPSAGRMPSLGIDAWPGVSVGLIIALIIVIFVQILLDRTSYGFELRVSGSNKSAARYAGINENQKIISALTISGAVAGICGYMVFANPKNPLSFTWDSGPATLLSDGFNGICVSLIAQNSPIGCIFSSILLAYLDSSQTALKSVSAIYNIHYTELIKAIIIYLASFSSFINLLFIKQHSFNDQFPAFTALVRSEEKKHGRFTDENKEKEAA